jgi:uncharacterized membrane protein YeaQ/YmgE (transglycosylase-associated protein family)
MTVSIVVGVLFGVSARWIAWMIARKSHSQGTVGTVAVCMVGILIGGWTTAHFGVTGFNLHHLLVAILDVVVLLFVVGLVTGRAHLIGYNAQTA